MENTQTLPQLQIPKIPSTECPKGNAAQIVDYFFQKYLGRATINIPGLGDVTPAKIQQITDDITGILNQINALAINVRYGSITGVSTTVANYPVSFTTPMPDTNYDIHIEFITSDSGTTEPPAWAVVAGSKSETGFSIRCKGTASVTSFNWSARQYSTT